MPTGQLTRDEALVYIPTSQNFFSKGQVEKTVIKNVRQHNNINCNELTLKSNTISDNTESLKRPKIILRKTDKKIYQSFKEMLLSYDQGWLTRRRSSNHRRTLSGDQRGLSWRRVTNLERFLIVCRPFANEHFPFLSSSFPNLTLEPSQRVSFRSSRRSLCSTFLTF